MVTGEGIEIARLTFCNWSTYFLVNSQLANKRRSVAVGANRPSLCKIGP